MTIELFRAEDFRCLEGVELEADPEYNLIIGPNASGKTSLLEALAYLGRGKSFRGAPVANLIRHGADAFVLFGKVRAGGRLASVGVRNSREGLEIRVDGASNGGSAGLAELLPLAVIDPNVHDLVGAGPDARRRYLDWLAFHVEHDFLALWRRYRRALKQRNAALKVEAAELDAWDAELVEHGLKLDAARRRVLELALPSLVEQGRALLQAEVGFDYRPGWAADSSLPEALQAARERDLAAGATQVGPHRADLRLVVDEHQARRLVSRGQQKLLASALQLGAVDVVQTALERPMLLLLDDPAAELDRDALQRLLEQVFALGCQLVVTALEPSALRFPRAPATFHVEHGALTPG
ncbi:MAG: DNA replication/repair protein RecF [Woeseiaceae bacterium]|nr:DNA replication/repair protein RecF [Woeseiaceae bacterium]